MIFDFNKNKNKKKTEAKTAMMDKETALLSWVFVTERKLEEKQK